MLPNLNALPHVSPYIFFQFSIVWRLFAMGYHALPSNLLKKVCINIFSKNIDGNAW